ncbi:MAG: UDP-2,3-diacylglucosamine diphosphatase [Gammaproteobacteria bacterium]|nr:UDP-2,3-diacylglucosamine diphosphatase [Gammaproteobacteria bacterium]
MTTLFISDLHLSPADSARIQLTVNFLKTQCSNIKELYILGDLFNTWLGDDIVPEEFEPLIDQLQQLHQAGIKTYLMVGNRDFMMGKHFAQRAGCKLLDDSCIIDLYGIKTLLLHGDTLCIDDKAYQRYRLWSRNKLLQWCFLHLSANYRQGISDKIKQKSREQKAHKSAMIMDVNQEEVCRVMKQFDVTQLIHGHTHRPAIHSLVVNNQQAKRIVLGDWESEISYLQCDEHETQLIDHRVYS